MEPVPGVHDFLREHQHIGPVGTRDARNQKPEEEEAMGGQEPDRPVPGEEPDWRTDDGDSSLLLELVAYLRENRTALREEWARRISEAELLSVM